MSEDESAVLQADLERPNVARMYDYFLGGSHNFAVDRELADRVIAADPEAVSSQREQRSFLRRVVALCLDHGIDQFLDLGSGIPTVGNVHELARCRQPDAKVAYVECEPVAVAHTRDLIRAVEGVSITHADLREPEAVLSAPTVADLVDFDRPVALLMLAILHFVSGDAGTIVASYAQRLAPGSAVAISHASYDWDDQDLVDGMRRRVELYRQSTQPGTLRDRTDVAALFDGVDLVEPGLVEIASWRPDTTVPGSPAGVYGGVGFVPARQP